MSAVSRRPTESLAAPAAEDAPGDAQPAPKPLDRELLRDTFLRALSPRQQLLAVLWYAERMTPAEIALVLEVGEEVVAEEHAAILRSMAA